MRGRANLIVKIEIVLNEMRVAPTPCVFFKRNLLWTNMAFVWTALYVYTHRYSFAFCVHKWRTSNVRASQISHVSISNNCISTFYDRYDMRHLSLYHSQIYVIIKFVVSASLKLLSIDWFINDKLDFSDFCVWVIRLWDG